MHEDEWVGKLKHSAKYAAIDEAVLCRVVGLMSQRYAKEKDVLDAAKRHLHIISGMYIAPPELKKAADILRQALQTQPSPQTVRETALSIMQRHASTRERLPVVDGFYAECMGRFSQITSVVDLGCGFQPFARPWMPVRADCVYRAYDLMPQTADMIRAFFDWAGMVGEAGVLDLLRQPPPSADLALMMKLLPVLEQQEKGAAMRLLEGLRCRYAVVTFPTRSVGGRQKGMASFYAEWMEQKLPACWNIVEKQEIGSELLYIVEHREESFIRHEGGEKRDAQTKGRIDI